MIHPRWNVVAALGIGLCCLPAVADEEVAFRPDQSELLTEPPEGAVVLLGDDSHRFVAMNGEPIDWPLEEGVLTSTSNGRNQNHIASTFHFRDAEIHVEFMIPAQGSGNSGVYLHGNYELQIQRPPRAGREPTQDDVGAVYGFAPPRVQAGLPPGRWQVYDIRYRAPRRNYAGEIVEEGAITAWLNGEQVQDETRFGEPRSVYHPFRYGVTPYLQTIHARQLAEGIGPVFLQDHGQPVKFRNMWVRPLDDLAGKWEAE